MIPTWQASALRDWRVNADGATLTARDGYLLWSIPDGADVELFSRDPDEYCDPGGWGWTSVTVGWEDGECRATVTRRCGDCDGVVETVTDYAWRASGWDRTYDRTHDQYAAAAGY